MSDRDDELSEARIRQIAMLRRATYRSRSYAIIAAVACCVATVELDFLAIGQFRANGITARPVLYFLLAFMAIAGAIYFIRRAVALHQEAGRTRVPAPTTPPDLSSLSDGSQIADNLNKIE